MAGPQIFLFQVTIKAPFAEIPRLPPGVEPLPDGVSEAYLAQLSDAEAGILGRTYIGAFATAMAIRSLAFWVARAGSSICTKEHCSRMLAISSM